MRREEWIEYLEVDEADLMEAEAVLDAPVPHGTFQFTKKRFVVLLAAGMLLAACFAVAAAGTQKGGGQLASYLGVSGEEAEELLEQLEVESGTAVEDAGYTMQVTEAASDGKSVYAVVTVTAPEGEPLEGERYVLEAGVPWIMTDRKGSGYACSGGGGINEMGRPAQNKVSFLLDWDFQGNLKGKKLVLEISRIVEENEGGQRVLADGNWTLVMDVPKSRTKSRLQWTRVETEGDVYYIYRVEVTPLGIHIHAVKWPGGETGAAKDSFLNLPVTIGYQDGSRENGSGEAAGSGGLFCEKTVHYDGNRLMDPEKIREVWLGETGLKLD